MTKAAAIERAGSIAIITITSPPVNALGIDVRCALFAAFTELRDDSSVKAIVLTCGGRTFFAGADISEFGKPQQSPSLVNVIEMIESIGKPVIAAIHGTALGGGLELALVCSHRLAAPSAKLGLPEVHLGILPGAGGTQRLPRIIGPQRALDMIVSGRSVGASEALEIGLIDMVVDEGRLVEKARDFADALGAEGKPILRVRDRQDKVDPFKDKPEIFVEFRAKNARTLRGLKAPENIVRAIEAAVGLPFEAGIKREAELFQELVTSTESAAQRYYFFAERNSSKIPDVPSSTPSLPIESVGVIGAGTMGGGIAMNFLNVGVPVTLVEMTQEALDRGLRIIRGNYENSRKKGKLTADQIEQRMSLINPVLDMGALAEADLTIEAVFEQMAVKKEIFAKLDAIAKPGAILASNTSFLSIDEIASVTSRPESVLGLHFFSPANVMRLLEVVRGKATSVEVLATAMNLAKRIGKAPVVSKVCHGFIANRMLAPRSRQADTLVLEGVSPQAVDNALYEYGFAMGPFAMSDLVGLDVIGRDSSERTVRGDLVAAGRLGQKKNGGYYDYDENRRPTPSPVATQVIAAVAAAKRIQPRAPLDDAEIVAHLLYPVVNEGARILEEGIAIRASDIDVACILGYNWPAYTGGPMFWADTVGLAKIVQRLEALAERYGPEHAPARLLKEKAASGGRLTE